MKLRSWGVAGPIALAACVLLAEGLPRLLGLLDFPTYQADAKIGYIPAPSQAGAFMRTNDWAFNALSMGVAAEFAPSSRHDTLLVGDSVVFGGNPYRQAEKLGPALQERLGEPVWPIAAGSWGIRNVLTYLTLHPEVEAGVDEVVFVLNSGDFDIASSWRCDRTHPREHPVLASAYLLNRYLLRWDDCTTVAPDMQVPEGDWRPEFRVFALRTPRLPMRLFLFPSRAEVETVNLAPVEKHARALLTLAGRPVEVFSIGRDVRWNASMYRDEIHPTPEGNMALAAIIAHPDPTTALQGRVEP